MGRYTAWKRAIAYVGPKLCVEDIRSQGGLEQCYLDGCQRRTLRSAARPTWNVLDLLDVLLPEQFAWLEEAPILEVMKLEQTMCEGEIVILKFLEVFRVWVNFAQYHLIGVVYLASRATDVCIWRAQQLHVTCEGIIAILLW